MIEGMQQELKFTVLNARVVDFVPDGKSERDRIKLCKIQVISPTPMKGEGVMGYPAVKLSADYSLGDKLLAIKPFANVVFICETEILEGKTNLKVVGIKEVKSVEKPKV